jgi:hypothetical protein
MCKPSLGEVCHGPELDVRPFQQLVQAVRLLRPLLHQALAVARQLAQPADRRGRDEAGVEQAMAQQIGQPLAVLHIGFAAGDRPHVLRVHQGNRARLVLQDVEDRSPVG